MRLLIFVFVVLFFTTSCKKNNDNETSICFTRTTTHLNIENKTDKVFYTASFGQSILPLIDWGPTCSSNNNIQPNSTYSRELSTILGYSNNDKLVVYWWECSNGRVQQVHTVILDRDQAVCQ